MSNIVTGTSRSRLSELRKFTSTGTLSNRYFTGGTISNDGVDLTASVDGEIIVYYIGDIRYEDVFNVNSGEYVTTNFEYTAKGVVAPNFEFLPIIKDSAKDNVISAPEVNSDVFIVRQALSIFENQYRLRAVSNLSELNFYAGGSNFNIINNT